VTVSVVATSGIADFHTGSETWGALADLCLKLAPETCVACRLWYTNDGDGLNAVSAIELAGALEARLSDGTIEQFICDKTAYANSLPDEICGYCGGSGIRTDAVGIKLGFDKRRIEEPDLAMARMAGAMDVTGEAPRDLSDLTIRSRIGASLRSLLGF
jgi:hypothetical protein